MNAVEKFQTKSDNFKSSGLIEELLKMEKVRFLLRGINPAFAAVLAMGTLISCEEEPTTIGEGVIGGEPFSTGQEVYDVFAFNKKIDAIPTNQLPIYQLGTFNDPVYGRTEARITSQISLAGGTGSPIFGNFSQQNEDNSDSEESSAIRENETVTGVKLFIPFLQNARADSDGDGVADEFDVDDSDSNSDSDGDGVSDNQERVSGTDPLNPDTDGDGVLDGDDDSTVGNIFPVRRDLDSIFGNREIAYNLKVQRSNFFLRDLDPSAGFQEAQEYFSTQQFPESLLGEVLFEGTAEISDEQTLIFEEDDPETEEDESLTIDNRFEPGILVDLDTQFFQENIIDKEGQSELLSVPNFNDFIRGLHLSVSSTMSGEDIMFLLDLTSAEIRITYEHDAQDDEEIVTQEKEYILNFLAGGGNNPVIGNAVNTLNNDAYPPEILNQHDTGLNASRIYLKGGGGSYAEIKLFDEVNGEDIINQIKANNWIINEANLVFHIDRDELNAAGTEYEPPRLYLYNAETNQPLYNTATETSSTERALGLFLNYDGIIEKSDDLGVKYTVRITDHINNIIVRDSANATLGLTLTPDIRIVGASKTMLAGGIEEEIAVSGNLNPLSTVLFGSEVPDEEEKKLQLEIFFTQTDN